ncbi:AMP-binding protein [Shewanella sp. 202IG2-18]|uniref:AMP-binding protein n=1 Tax=Parashewanella hymeniacidonis TaxID=2807618 RepID=UPI0019613CCF|nr:AMP-binding protein [Parashewanella hymeniacidonis]MBM7074157.1 AMP-binding protein [Parashewanella hymeniacidonis]
MPQSQSNQAVLESSFLVDPTSFPLLEHTIGHHLDPIVQAYPKQLAVVVCHQDIHWTYQQLLQNVQSVALGLLELDIKLGDRVGIWSPNNIEWVLVQYATAYIGAVMVCVNPAYREYELEYALNLSECKALICSEQFHSINYISM